MKDIVSKILAKIKATGASKVDVTYLKDNSWFHVNSDVLKAKTVFIFKSGGQLLISKDGDITKATWENLIHSTNSLIIEINEKPVLYNIIFLTSDYLVIQKDGTDIVEVFIKQQRYENKLPHNPDENPINIMYDDLKMLLNKRNTDREETKPVDKQISSNREFPVKSQISTTDLSKLIRETLTNVLNESQSTDSSNFTFEKIEILQRIKKHYDLSKDDEVKFFLEMEAIEEELLSEGVLCFTCKTHNDIGNEICDVCKENPFPKSD